MSVVIIGGNECMEKRYKEICEAFGFMAKVYTKENGMIKKKIGKPDLLICFTGTVSHKMVKAAKQEAKKVGIPMEHCHSSSGSALTKMLRERAFLNNL